MSAPGSRPIVTRQRSGSRTSRRWTPSSVAPDQKRVGGPLGGDDLLEFGGSRSDCLPRPLSRMNCGIRLGPSLAEGQVSAVLPPTTVRARIRPWLGADAADRNGACRLSARGPDRTRRAPVPSIERPSSASSETSRSRCWPPTWLPTSGARAVSARVDAGREPRAPEHRSDLRRRRGRRRVLHRDAVRRRQRSAGDDPSCNDGCRPTSRSSILTQLAGALDAAHTVRLIHRDVKPSNVLMSSTRATTQAAPHAWLGDFGLSKRLGDSTVSPTERPLGTVHYMAPEQIRGQRLDARADIYSLGCLLYQCLTGEVPIPARVRGRGAVRPSRGAAPARHRAATPTCPRPAGRGDLLGAGQGRRPSGRRRRSSWPRPRAAALARKSVAPSPQMPAATPDPPSRAGPRRRVVGRLAEAEQLVSALDDAMAGEGGVILLAGEPGIGKTTLARGLSEQAERRGVPAVWGVGLSAEAAPPYWHWIQVVASDRGLARCELSCSDRSAAGRGGCG